MMLNLLAMFVPFDQLGEVVVTTLVFVAIGLVFFAIAFGLFTVLMPFLGKEGNRRRSEYGIGYRNRIDVDRNRADYICCGPRIVRINK